MKEYVEHGREEGSKRRIPGLRSLPFGQYVPARVNLGILSFFGFFTNYMLRVNLSIAIVSMVKTDSSRAANDSFFSNNTENDINSVQLDACFQRKNLGINETDIVPASVVMVEEDSFEWDSVSQGILLGSFYWTYLISLVPGAMLARRYGGKLIYGIANLVFSIVTMITPYAARHSFALLIIVRAIGGLVSGTTWPAMHTLASHWIPPHERSKFVTTYMGNAVGTAFTYPLCGLLIHKYGWASAFYVPGCLTLVWCILWWILVFDYPNLHPRITREERDYIERHVPQSLHNTKLTIPWLNILRSPPFWAVAISFLASLWTFMLIITYAPTYFRTVHGFDIQSNGLLSGLPNIMRFVSATVVSQITDGFIKSKMYSVTVIRKVNGLISLILPVLFYLLMTNVGCNSTAEIIILCLASTMSGAITSGPLANTMDLAPNFSGILMSMTNFVAMSSGFLVPSVVGSILHNDYSRERWRIVFIISACVSAIGGVVYACFGSSETQPWNSETREEKRTKNVDVKYSQVLNADDTHISTELEDLHHMNEILLSKSIMITEKAAAGDI